MNKAKWLLLAVALILTLTVASPMVAEETKEKPAAKEKTPAAEKAKDALRGEYAIMASECKLTEDQQTALKAKLAARDAALAEWTKANGEKFKALQEALKKAREAGDKDAAKKASDELKTVEAERAKINAQFQADLQAILTPEQKAAWEVFRLYRAMMARYKKANLTDEQTAKIREACAAAAKEAAAATGDEKTIRKAQADAEAKLRKTIEDTILTAEQKTAIAQQPAKAAKESEKKEAEKPKVEQK